MVQTEFAQSYCERKEQLSAQVVQLKDPKIRLGKETSNLFRDRIQDSAGRLKAKDFNHLLEINSNDHTLTAEGMMTYAQLTDSTLKHGFMPHVVPQLKTITIGGAVSGIGIESTSFRYGLPHERVLEMDVLLADGTVVCCTPTNEYSDLYYGIPNSYGTLGYILKLKTPALPVKPYVRLEHTCYHNADEFFSAIQTLQNSDVDFLDGCVFSRGEYYITCGWFDENASTVSDYTYLDIYYKSIRNKQQDYLSVKDYIWRWDTDWFWCSKNLYVQNGIMRRIVGRDRLNSETYTKVMRWNTKWGLTRKLNRLAGLHSESVIQDIDIPISNAPQFLDFLLREVGVLPIWICPIGTSENSERFSLFSMKPNSLYINFGFWDSVKFRERQPVGYINRKIERKTIELAGKKSLYSDSFFPEDEFWSLHGRDKYWLLKEQYDPQCRLLNLYEKTVLRR